MKYEFTGETKHYFGITLKRIRATAAIKKFNVAVGDLGGWIEDEKNLDQSGNAWVYGDAQVFGDAWVFDNAQVFGDAEVKSSEDYCVYKNTWSSFRWFTYTKSNKMWSVGCFYGTGAELIAEAYKDSELSGRCYEAIVKAQDAIELAKKAR